ncbi:SMI1/KNR4 family protein [uncultured Flavobacterium sp.]|jgi:hypothetical protein|uniref:SMI1/KNR4 family protein n=1 Tax=uncultured Flavobacterium sp. TaxID=165435 RepID=UPI0012174EEB|nr:SMI1/KNR4 family protein [uncultured Flavobacterium sp.]THD32923.1 MAG: hypothetical protein DI588_06775 [Flavobacterium johnsoniae]
MEIEYLIKMKNTPKIKYIANRGLSEEKIEQVESKMGIKFPKAFKEFLYLGGDYEEIINDWNRGFDNLELIQEEAEESFVRVGLGLTNFFAFAEYARDQFIFFFLDEGENPPVYMFAEEKFHKNDQGEYVYYKKTDTSFSECIDSFISSALK